MNNKKGQGVSEYAIILGVVAAALVTMTFYFQRSIQVVIKSPVDNLGGFGSEVFSPQRIQEIGIEDNVNPIYGPRDLSQSKFSIDKEHTIITSEGGQRKLNMTKEKTDIPKQKDIIYNQVSYDQVTRPNVPEHQY